MPFSVNSSILDDIERRRRQQEALTASSQQASGQATDALGKAQALAEQQVQRAQQAEQFKQSHLLAQQAEGDRVHEAEANQRLRLRESNVANAARVNKETQDAYNEKHRQDEAGDKLRLMDDTEKRLEAKDDTAQKNLERKSRVEVLVRGGVDKGLPDDEIALALSNHLGIDVDPLEVRGMRAKLGLESKAATAKIDLTEAQADKAKRVPGPKPPKPPKGPSSAVTDKLARYSANIDSLRDVAAHADEYDWGPASSRANDMAQAMGLDDTGFTGAKSELMNTINDQINLLSGANVPVQEFSRLKKGLPLPTDNDPAFKTKLKQTLIRLERLRMYLEKGNNVPLSPTPDIPVAPLTGGLDTPEKRKARLLELQQKAGM